MVLFTSVALISSCSKDESNPPKAGFSYEPSEVTQYDKIVFISTATSDDISYTISGGDFAVDPIDNKVQFLDAATYTVVQTAKNSDGSTTATETITVSLPVNTYMLDSDELNVTGNAFWYDASAMGGTVYIRMLSDVEGQDNPNLLKLYPVAGANPLEGSYSFNGSGDIGTYNTGLTAGYAGWSWDWTANGTEGDNLVIDLVYKGDTFEDNIYDITLSNSTLDYGNYDAAWNWVSEGTKVFKVTYRGKIDPAAVPSKK